ncbi:protein kinase domain-containing protein [Frigoriglobus tundricola]|uniref:Protein kinase domain-containing protein n=1 Tax=Frigoriglobus tundricola TaxID=2774151 RepID=A0A6M5YI38_9BACT|nr:protein kinase [Frigoriglobus tundricola]QJW92991.1 hypothetical protein FTUN_0491 [Frigoriglobus tundricola]
MSPTDRTKADPCFPADEIRALLLGRGAGAAADRLARHISSCPRCAAVAEAIGLDSGIVSGLRRDALPPAPSDRELADVVARVGRIDRSSRAGGARGAPAADVPARLGPYRLYERLGTGGMGVVYRAEDTALHRFVAVKVVKGSADAGTRARFLSEARALAAVRHDNVVTVHYVGEEPTAAGAIPYLAMELLEGQTLRDWMATAPLPPIDWVVHVGRQIASGLAFAHSAGLVHRDVKPANLWLEAPQGWATRPPETRPTLAAVGRVKLLDFGLAHPPGVAAGAGAAGTLAYMSPNRRATRPLTRGRTCSGSAVCSTSCVRAGCHFPTGAGAGPGTATPRRAPVRSLNPAVPERLADLIERLLAADRADRPGSARAVELELADLDPHSAGPPTESGQSDATVIIRPGRRPRRSRRLVMLVALVVAGAVVAFARTTRTDTTHNPPADGFVPQPTAVTETTEPTITDQQKTLASSDVIDEEWCRALSTLPPQQQVNVVLRALGKSNPQFEWIKGSGWAEPDRVIRLTVNADTVSDLRPVRALTALTVLRCRGSAPGRGTLTDLSPLSELKLQELHCRNNPNLRDLSPIQLDHLGFVDASFTGLETLVGLSEAPLVTLKISGTPIRDLGPVRKMSKLKVLTCIDCPITDFEPLTAIRLRELNANVQVERDAAVLKRIHTLEKINDVPVAEFWKSLPPTTPN